METGVSRRGLLGAAGVAAGAVALGLGVPSAADASRGKRAGGHGKPSTGENGKPPRPGGELIPQGRRGLALYSVRDAVDRDPSLWPNLPSGFYRVFEAAAAAGYANIEFFSFTRLPTFNQHADAPGGASVSPRQIKRWLDEFGLKARGFYGNINSSTIDASLDVAEQLEMPFMGSGDPAGVPGSLQRDVWDRVTADWNLCAAKAARRGIPLYAHAHWVPWDFLRDSGPRDAAGEYTRSSGVRAMDYWLANTDPRWVTIQIDTYWMFIAQTLYNSYTAPDGTTVTSRFDPIATAVRHARRSLVFHAKDGLSAKNPPRGYVGGYVWSPFGAGEMPLEELFNAVVANSRKGDVPYLNIEQDNGPGNGDGLLTDPQKSMRDAAESCKGLAALQQRRR